MGLQGRSIGGEALGKRDDDPALAFLSTRAALPQETRVESALAEVQARGPPSTRDRGKRHSDGRARELVAVALWALLH